MNAPKVSIIIPVYNVEPYIGRCARSLFEQTLDSMEYLFVNDCTPDHSMEVLQQVLNSYPNRQNQVRIINQPCNMGASKAREVGIKAASGEYIIHCDSDDWVDKNMYCAMYEKAMADRLDYVMCRSLYYSDGKNNKLVTDIIKQDKYEFIQDILNCHTTVSLWNRLVKRSLFKENDFIYPVEHFMEDRTYAVQIAFFAQSYGCVNGPYYYYFQNEDSICGNHTDEIWLKKFNQATANMRIIEIFLDKQGLLDRYKDALRYNQHVVKQLLLPLLKKSNKYRILWLNSFPGETHSHWLSKRHSLSSKIISFFILIGVYPLINKALRR